MSNQNPVALPAKHVARSETINIRLAPDEKRAAEAVANRLGVTLSHMTRHFLLQAVAFYAARSQPKDE